MLLEQGRKQFGTFLDLSGVIPAANNGPKAEVMRAALRAVLAWVEDGTTSPEAEPLDVSQGRIVRDEHGIARGGVRTPAVDAPIAVYSGEGAGLIGSTTPFPAEKLRELYPTQQNYVDAVERSAHSAVEDGFLLRYDAEAIIDDAGNA